MKFYQKFFFVKYKKFWYSLVAINTVFPSKEWKELGIQFQNYSDENIEYKMCNIVFDISRERSLIQIEMTVKEKKNSPVQQMMAEMRYGKQILYTLQ